MQWSRALLPVLTSVAMACAPGGVSDSPRAPSAASAPAAAAGSRAPADAVLARADLAAYHGWIQYLRFAAEHAVEAEREAAQARLDDWARRILDDPALLGKLRGVQEWAYLSPVDGSGQPFKLNIPTDYDAARPAPVSVYLHGYSGNHLEHATGMADHPGHFEVSVLGRSRGGGYLALSEADVLHVLDYLERHWVIDLDRVHVNGGSMGGGGTYWLGSRYPHRFASGRAVCGYASHVPVGNLLTLPLYATHSDDDWRVPVLHARGPLGWLKSHGAELVLDEVTGYGHAVWEYEKGNREGEAWAFEKVRRAAKDVRQLDFTALDGNARRAFWAEVAEWGPEPAPARFRLSVGDDNRLSVELDNVAALALDLQASPLDAGRNIAISVAPLAAAGSPRSTTLDVAPGSQRIVLRVDASGAIRLEPEPPTLPHRLHTPGGAALLYAGEPLLIVYGTRGSAEAQAAMREAAEVASQSSDASWSAPGAPGIQKDGVPHHYNLYGNLPIQADVDVTVDDLRERHLVLIGTAAENAVVERLASRLPVRREAGDIVFDDGLRVPAEDRALGLVHYNPAAPERLIFWVSADRPAVYAAESLIPQMMWRQPSAFDAVVTVASRPELVLTRSFDSRWRWLPRDRSPLASLETNSGRGVALALAAASRKSARSDFALGWWWRDRGDVRGIEPGVTRVGDLAPYFEPLSVMELTGAEILAAHAKLSGPSPDNDTRYDVAFEPTPVASRLKPKQTYRVAIGATAITPFVRSTHLAPKQHAWTEHTVAQALRVAGPAAAASERQAARDSR